MENAQPINMLLFCPNCLTQHIDAAKPDVCETCGADENLCECPTFTAWLNPPHKSHRCGACNHVWRPADVPTNGVAAIQTKGQNDGNPLPRQYGVADDIAAWKRNSEWLHWLEEAGVDNWDGYGYAIHLRRKSSVSA